MADLLPPIEELRGRIAENAREREVLKGLMKLAQRQQVYRQFDKESEAIRHRRQAVAT